MKHIQYILIFLSLICVCICDTLTVPTSDLIMLFPSYARDINGVLSLRLTGMIYHYDSENVIFPAHEGAQPKFQESKPLNALLKIVRWNDGNVGQKVTMERALRFIAEKPVVKPVNISLEVGGPLISLNKWNGFGELVASAVPMTRVLDLKVVPNDSGYFDVDVPMTLDGNDKEKLFHDEKKNFFKSVNGSTELFWLKASTKHLDDSKFRIQTMCPMTVINPTQLHVISDIDDTVKVSGINRGLLNIFKLALVKTYTSVDRMPQFLTSLAQESIRRNMTAHVSYTFLSGVPWPMTPAYINEFLIPQGFPWANMFGKPKFALQATHESSGTTIGSNSTDVPSSPETASVNPLWTVPDKLPDGSKPPSQYVFKFDALSRILDPAVWKQLILIGDSTEADYKVYQTIAERLGFRDRKTGKGAVQCIFIRYVAPARKFRPANFYQKEIQEEYSLFIELMKKLYANMPNWEQHVRIFSTGNDLMNVDVLGGQCHSSGSESVWKQAAVK